MICAEPDRRRIANSRPKITCYIDCRYTYYPCPHRPSVSKTTPVSMHGPWTMRWNRVTGSLGQRFWPGRVTGQCIRPMTRCLTRFCVLTCAFIVALFLQS